MPGRRKRVGVARIGRTRGRPGPLARATTAQLRQELERRQNSMHELIRQRDALSAELADLEAAFGPATSSSANGVQRAPGRRKGRGGRRAKGGSLVEVLGTALKGQRLAVNEMIKAVQNAGYKTTSSNFRSIIAQALIKHPKRFKRVERGIYTAR